MQRRIGALLHAQRGPDAGDDPAQPAEDRGTAHLPERGCRGDDAREPLRVVRHVLQRDQAAHAMTIQEQRQAGLLRPHKPEEAIYIAPELPLRHDVSARACGAPVAAQIERPDRVDAGDEMLDQGRVSPAVLAEAVHEGDHRPRRVVRQPWLPGELRSAHPFHRVRSPAHLRFLQQYAEAAVAPRHHRVSISGSPLRIACIPGCGRSPSALSPTPPQ